MFPGNDIVSSLIAVQMGGTGGKAKAKTITKNGAYAITDEEKSEGYVGYSPVTVDVPTGANIIPLTVTANGTYHAADYGCDGFDPVNVNVPDRYDEGYQDGYQKGYEDGQENGGYTFPDGTPYDDIVNITGADTNITDETIGISIVHLKYTDELGYLNWDIRAYSAEFPDHEKYFHNLWGVSTTKIFYPDWVSIQVTDPTTGTYVVKSYDPYYQRVDETTGQDNWLIGFGASGHTYTVSNNR